MINLPFLCSDCLMERVLSRLSNWVSTPISKAGGGGIDRSPIRIPTGETIPPVTPPAK